MTSRGKYMRDLTKAVEEAGGEVSLTRDGHLRVQGPNGVAVVGSDGSSWRAAKNAVRDIKNHAGLPITVRN